MNARNGVKEVLFFSVKNEIKAYLLYLESAKIAEKEGFKNVAKLFRATAEAELIHAKRFFRLYSNRDMTEDDLKEIMNQINIDVGSTKENLTIAIKNEDYENKELYVNFSKKALSANNVGAFILWNQTALVEGIHRDSFKKALEYVSMGRDIPINEIFLCPVCGYVALGNAPFKCPICDEPGKNFRKF